MRRGKDGMRTARRDWKIVLWTLAIVMAVQPSVLQANERRTESTVKRQRDAVHLIQPVKNGDSALSDTLDGAITSLQAGHEVVILFDARSVTSLRMNPRKGNGSPLEETKFPEGERQTLANRLGVGLSEAPRNYLEYVQHLAKAGAKVFVNRNAIRLYGLTEEEIHPVAKPISTRQMAELLDEADLCYTYGGR